MNDGQILLIRVLAFAVSFAVGYALPVLLSDIPGMIRSLGTIAMLFFVWGLIALWMRHNLCFLVNEIMDEEEKKNA